MVWDDATASRTVATCSPGGRCCLKRFVPITDDMTCQESRSRQRWVGTSGGTDCMIDGSTRLLWLCWPHRIIAASGVIEDGPEGRGGTLPSISCRIALETLAVKAFGDMDQTARLSHAYIGSIYCWSWIIRDLRRHLDSVSPETSHPGYCWSLPGVGESCRFWRSEVQ